MKKILSILVVIILFSSTAISCNTDGYPVFYEKYKNENNVVSFRVPTGFIKFFLDKEDQDLKNILEKINDFRLFIADDSSKILLPTLKTYLPTNKYKDVMIINDSGNRVSFKALEKNSSISEIIMLVEEDNSFVVMSIDGNFSYDDMKKLVKSVNTDKVTNTKN